MVAKPPPGYQSKNVIDHRNLYAPPPFIATPLQPWLVDFMARVRKGVAAFTSSTGVAPYATNWWRSDAHNDRVGGHRYSQHLLGLAVDLVPSGYGAMHYDALRRAMAAAELVAINEGDHVHVQDAPAGSWNHVIDAARRAGLLAPEG